MLSSGRRRLPVRLPLRLAFPASSQDEVGNLLRIGRGAPDFPGIFLQGLDPALDVGGAAALVVAHADGLAGHHGAGDCK